MNTIYLSVCDDQDIYLTGIKNIISNYCRKKHISCSIDSFNSGKKFLNSENLKLYDIIFLDVEMPQINGIDTARELRQRNKDAFIVFVTSHEEYAINAFEVKACDYIKKPFEEERIYSLLDELYSGLKSMKTKAILIEDKEKGDTKLSADQILYIEKELRKIKIVTENEVFYTTGTIKKFEKKLESYETFVKCNQGILVNVNNILTVKNQEILLSSNEVIFASRRCSPDIKKAFYERINRL